MIRGSRQYYKLIAPDGKEMVFDSAKTLAKYINVDWSVVYKHSRHDKPIYTKNYGTLRIVRIDKTDRITITETTNTPEAPAVTKTTEREETNANMKIEELHAEEETSAMTYSEAMRVAYAKKKIILEGQNFYYFLDSNFNLRRHYLDADDAKKNEQDAVVVAMPFYDTIKDRWHEWNGINLAEEEKSYIASIIKPFRKVTKSVKKGVGKGGAYLSIAYTDTPFVTITHFFTASNAFNEMTTDYAYTLEELGL